MKSLSWADFRVLLSCSVYSGNGETNGLFQNDALERCSRDLFATCAAGVCSLLAENGRAFEISLKHEMPKWGHLVVLSDPSI